MCDEQPQQEIALISQNRGTILVIVAWFLAGLLALSIIARIIARCKLAHLRHLSSSGDVVIFIAGFCALASTAIISTAYDWGLGKRRCLLGDNDLENIERKLFVSTILFVLAISISKSSVLLFLYRLAQSTLRRVCVAFVGTLVLVWTIAVLAVMVFQCEMPNPWTIWTGNCIPLVQFWVIAIIFDIVLDTAMMLLSAHTVWKLPESRRQKILATLVLLLRSILIVASVIRLIFLEQALNRDADPTFDSIPYFTTTLAHGTLAVLLACTLWLNPYSRLQVLRAPKPSQPQPESRDLKYWADTTVGTPYESYNSLAANLPIMREPLPSIQASMSMPNSPTVSSRSLGKSILLPDKPMPMRYGNPPSRPPRPTEEQRPDLSMFYGTTITIQQPPMVTLLGNLPGRDVRLAGRIEKPDLA